MKRLPIHKHIYPTVNGKYSIDKSIKGKYKHFKVCNTMDEAINYRDQLIKNNWEPLPETIEEKTIKKQNDYYKYIQIRGKGYTYSVVTGKNDYLGSCPTIEEALYYRDLFLGKKYDEIPRPKDIDLKTDNPYLKSGLKYPLPERLKLKERNKRYGKGTIVKKGRTSFHVHHGKKGDGFKSYVCACPTYEMAWYVRNEMNKLNWDMSQLQRVIDDYPKWYTKLLFFYQYVNRNPHREGKWVISIPHEFLLEDRSIELITGYSHIEDALFERDFLVEHDWDYNVLVEQINDEDNHYYGMDLPPYPSRKVRRVKQRDFHEKELSDIIDLYKMGVTKQGDICESLNINEVTLRSWLSKFYNSNWLEFTSLIEDGLNPLDVLEKQELIIQPDLSRALPNNYKGYVHHLKRGTFQVNHKNEYYGSYPTEELARKIVKDLIKVNWDKSKLKSIQAKHGYVSPVMSKRWVYKSGNNWAVRRKNKEKRMLTYGVYKDKRIADLVRDMLIEYGWNIDNMSWIDDFAKVSINNYDLMKQTMFGRVTIDDIEYVNMGDEATNNKHYFWADGKYYVVKSFNGYNKSFGEYSNKYKAIRVVEFLKDNNWDKELLDTMLELGEI